LSLAALLLCRDEPLMPHRFAGSVWKKMGEDDAFLLASAIAWEVLFAGVSFLALGVGVTGYFLSARFDDPAAAVLQLFASNFPQGETGEALSRLLSSVVNEIMNSRTGLTVAGSLIFVWLATRLSATLRRSLARVFDTEDRRGIVHGKLFDIGAVLVGVILVAVNLGVTVMVAGAVQFGIEVFGLGGSTVSWAERLLGATVSLVSIWMLFLLIYRFLPRVKTPWRTALIASACSAFAHDAWKFGFSWYVTEVADYASALGGIATSVLILLWIYYGALVFIVCGEVAQVYSTREARAS
jgi:membrane protein